MTRALLALLTLGAAAALADVPPPDSAGCAGKAAGAGCTRDDGSSGVCADATCSRNDYSNGPPPTQVSYACLRCVAGAAPPAGKKAGCAAAPGVTLALLAALLGRRRRPAPHRR